MYFIAKVKMEMPNGEKMQKVTESYLVEAETPTDVEAIVTKDFEGATYDWEVTAIVKSNIKKILKK